MEKFCNISERTRLQTIVRNSTTELLEAFAKDFKNYVSDLLQHKDTIEIVLTGGTLGIQVLRHISKLPLPWQRLSFQFGDERFVGLKDSERNEFQALLAWPELSELKLHRYPDSGVDLESARELQTSNFEMRLGKLPELDQAFDLVILGMGPDGHVASLFPGHNYGESWVVSESDSPKPPSQRLSLSFQALNKSAEVWFLASGKEKADAVRCGMSKECELPVAKVRGKTQTRWYLDSELSDAL